ncbi:hypothetical protein MJO28_015440 [Puccinia striiformis f. sp. tritici]|uniref:Uncharacterized protein n=1 Tax=Puccinia striiformis f. sp. tritici TaxID=168172 RepID=A0ACC0DUK6_9BASI|nr:hypothetical protein MJO28_015440 [Puccinia striiformis f. sp. tritici]
MVMVLAMVKERLASRFHVAQVGTVDPSIPTFHYKADGELTRAVSSLLYVLVQANDGEMADCILQFHGIFG